MIQILPKPIPKYGDSPFKSQKVEEDKIEDILGEHTKLIKKVLSGLTVRKDSVSYVKFVTNVILYRNLVIIKTT